MAEREEPAEPAGAEVQPVDSPAALALALSRASRSSLVDEEAAAFLRDQRGLVEKQSRMLDLQMEGLHEDRALSHRHQGLRYFGDRLRVALQLLAIGFGAAIVLGVGAMVWDAHKAHGLVIEAFHTPPGLAGPGLDGTLAEGMLVDRMNALVASADAFSFRKASTISNDWGEDIKIEIPQTGVSIGDLQLLLHKWLGHETHITGEVYRSGSGLAVTVRAGGGQATTARGSDADLAALMGRAAEGLFAQTQPYRYAIWLENQNRFDEAEKLLAADAAAGSSEERAWAYEGWFNLLVRKGDNRAARQKSRLALSLAPGLISACPSIADWSSGHWQRTLDDNRACQRALRLGLARDYSPSGAAFWKAAMPVTSDDITGDWSGEFTDQMRFLPIEDFEGGGTDMAAADFAAVEARMHDVSASRRRLAAAPEASDGFVLAHTWMNGPYLPHFDGFAALDDWKSAITDLETADRDAHAAGNAEDVRQTYVWPLLAYAYQRVGRAADADALIARTSLDCDFCLMLRGRIAAVRGDWAGAARWFAASTRMAPDIPFAYSDWGEMLLAKGDVTGAIAQLDAAHRKGPHFADPLEMWGEALMRQRDYAGAAAKFEEAAKYAPRWGRDHMLWGEALARLGKASEARAQWRFAASMDLSVKDRAELSSLRA